MTESEIAIAQPGIELVSAILEAFRPPPDLTVSQWADEYRRLSSESSAEPGRWVTARAEYQRGIMDSIRDPEVHTTVIMSSAQVGKTEILNNAVGYHVHFEPAPILVLQPTLQMGEAWSKDRLAPMLRDTPALKGKVADAKSRDSGNTLLHKTFPGGHITIAGANSPASLASRPIRVVLFDEVDRYPESAGDEGDPISLASKRQATFWNRHRIIVSTPTVRGFSRIEAAFKESDQRFYNVPCPHCGELHVLRWTSVKWEKNEPKTARFQCPQCLGLFTDGQKNSAVSLGRWIATAPFRGTAGFHISALYSPWTPLASIVEEFLSAKDYPERLRTWINTALGETFEESGAMLDENALLARVEKYPDGIDVPARAVVITIGADVQPDRIEAEAVAWGPGEESWSVEYARFEGDPDIKEGQPGSPWDAFTQFRLKQWRHENGSEMGAWGACIDSGGHNTQAVYDYVRPLSRAEHVVAIKGDDGESRVVITNAAHKRTGKENRRVDLHIVGVDNVKSMIHRALRIEGSGSPRYCHFPSDRDIEYFKQFTAEKQVTETDTKGYKRRVWKLIAGRRNEALDCRVYAWACLYMTKMPWLRWTEELKRSARSRQGLELEKVPVDEKKPAANEPPKPRVEIKADTPPKVNRLPRRGGGGFANSWR